MKYHWFKTKKYGWGWTPVTWQGWFIILSYILFVSWNFFRIDSHSHSVSDTLITFVPETIVFTGFLIIICLKTGEKPKWRWGKKKK
jgi:hypothetical protein